MFKNRSFLIMPSISHLKKLYFCVQTAKSFKEIADNWNIGSAKWLRHVSYERTGKYRYKPTSSTQSNFGCVPTDFNFEIFKSHALTTFLLLVFSGYPLPTFLVQYGMVLNPDIILLFCPLYRLQ